MFITANKSLIWVISEYIVDYRGRITVDSSWLINCNEV